MRRGPSLRASIWCVSVRDETKEISKSIAAGRRYGNGAPPGGEDVPESMALSVKKNRYNGHTGKIDIAFNPAISSFYETKREGTGAGTGSTPAPPPKVN